MADDTDTTRPGEAEAVTRVWASNLDLNCSGGEVRAIIANAYPVIAAAVREQAAQDIEAAKAAETGRTPIAVAYWLGLEDAADIVRGGR